MIGSMKPGSAVRSFTGSISGLILIVNIVAGPGLSAAQPKPEAVSDFNTYISQVESRLDQQHLSPKGFLVAEDAARLQAGEQIIARVPPPAGTDLPGAMLHHWRGTAFVPGATAADFDRVMKSFEAYPTVYAPQLVQTSIVSHEGDHFQVQMRTRQKHVITVVMDMTLDVTFGSLDEGHRHSLSRSTDIKEIESAGTSKERALGPSENRGMLWNLNTYWSSEERDGGLYIQIESVSLSRSIPPGLAWAIKPFVESVPKESLAFTLSATREALSKK